MRYEDIDQEFKKLIIERVHIYSPFWALIGMELVDIKKGWAITRLAFSQKITQIMGVVHGGAIFSLADSAVAMALLGLVEQDEIFATVEMKINYLKPFNKGELTAEASIIHMGSTIAIGDVDVKNGDGVLIAKALATYMIMKKRNE